MTNNEMIDLLGLRLEDPDKKAFSSTARYKALNIAQMQIVNFIDNQLLTELEFSETKTADASGKIPLTGLTHTPIRNGVYAVYNGNSSVKAFANMIEFKDIKRLENTYLKPSYTNPVAYIFANTINIKPSEAHACDVYYLRKPTDINSGADCELDESLHQCVCDFAEAQLWKMDGQYQKSADAMALGSETISALNTRLGIEKPQGVGTYGRAVPGPTTGA